VEKFAAGMEPGESLDVPELGTTPISTTATRQSLGRNSICYSSPREIHLRPSAASYVRNEFEEPARKVNCRHDQLSYRRHRFPPPIIQHAIWLYLRFHAELPRRGGATGRARP